MIDQLGQLGNLGGGGSSGIITPYQIGNRKYVYDMYNTGALFQDKNGTTPVTNYGQSVGLQLDLSGNGNHRFSESAARPLYIQDANGKPCFRYNGIGQFMQTNPFAWESDEVCVIAGVRKLSDAAVGVLAEFSRNVSLNNGSFYLRSPHSSVNEYGCASKGSFLRSAVLDDARFVAPITNIIALKGKISTDICKLYIDSLQVAENTSDQETDDYGTHAMYFGARGETTPSLFFNGYEYSSCAFNKIPTDSKFAAMNRWVNNKTLAYVTGVIPAYGVDWNESTDTYEILNNIY